MIPFSTTLIKVFRRDEEQMYAEPYSGLAPEDRNIIVAEDVRAVIDVAVGRQAGIERNRGGESVRTELRLVCDMCDLQHTDQIYDTFSGLYYDISWLVKFPPQGTGDDTGHIEAGVINIQGVIS